MRRPLFEYILFSGVLHGLTAALLVTVVLPKSLPIDEDNITVNIIEKPKGGPNLILPPSSGKYAKRPESEKGEIKSNKNDLNDGAGKHKSEPVDLSTYGNQIKAKIDPIWYNKVYPYLREYSGKVVIEVLVRIDKTGLIKSVELVSANGPTMFVKFAKDTFKEAVSLPKPPNSKEILNEGIIWTFTL